MMINCWTRKKVKRSSHSGDIPWKIIKQPNYQRTFWAKTQDLGCQTNLNNWINLLFLRIPSHMQKISITASIQSWYNEDLILEKTSGMPRCAWSRAYEWTESYRCIYVCLSRYKKSNLYLNSLRDIANLLFSITLRMSDHTHLKWPNKFLTSMNS